MATGTAKQASRLSQSALILLGHSLTEQQVRVSDSSAMFCVLKKERTISPRMSVTSYKLLEKKKFFYISVGEGRTERGRRRGREGGGRMWTVTSVVCRRSDVMRCAATRHARSKLSPCYAATVTDGRTDGRRTDGRRTDGSAAPSRSLNP